MSKLFKRMGYSLSILVLVSNSLVVSALTTVSGYVSVNNSTDTDYKTTEEYMSGIVSKLPISSDHSEIINYDTNKKTTENSVLNYLIENDLVSSDLNISYDGIKVTPMVIDKFDFRGDSNITKSDFLVTLAKSIFGVKESRPIIFNTKASRWVNGKEQLLSLSDQKPSNYSGDDNEFDYTPGDYSVYVSPNVYESYYKDLVSSGVVDISEFSDSIFIETYKTFGTTVEGKRFLPSWSDSLGLYDVLSDSEPSGYSIQQGSSVLGSGFDVVKDGFNVTINSKDSSWFFDEDLLTIDALTYIEKALRINEKEMTKTEADVITYKYGVKYINRVPNENKDTIKFLVAKGVLNFENEEEFSNLFKPLTGEFFRTLIYRIHNQNARYNFSSIQLTDSDNYWLSEGFSQTTINLYEGSAPYFETEVEEFDPSSEVTEVPSIRNLFGVIKSREKIIASDTVSNNKNYVVTRVFNTSSNKFYYKGKELNKNTPTSADITSVQYVDSNKTLVVKFKVLAASSVASVAIIDANMSVKSSSGVTTVGSIPAVSYSNVDGSDASDTFVSQSALNDLVNMPILVVNDKYLINKQTGAKALILNDNRKALIGNHVFNLKDTVVYGLNGEVYYNLSIIKYLLNESMLSSLDPTAMFYTNGFGANEKLLDVKNINGQIVDQIYVRDLKSRTPDSNSSEIRYDTKTFYNISHASSLGNFIIYDLANDLGYPGHLNMIIEFRYVLPDSSNIGVDQTFIDRYKNNQLTVSNVYDSLYERPTNAVLQEWWDSNLTFSNSLVNYIMGTENVKYVNSGYLMPTINVLGDLGGVNADGVTYYSKLNSLFENGIGLQSNFLSSVKSNSGNKLDFIKSYFNYQSNFLINSQSTVLDGLIYQRTFSYHVGTVGKYYNNKINVKEDSNYTEYIDYAVVDSNGNIYQDITKTSFLKYYEANKSYIELKDIPGVSYKSEKNMTIGNIYEVSNTTSQADANKILAVAETNGKMQVSSLAPQILYSNGVELFPNKDYTGKIATTISAIGNDLFGEGNWGVPDWVDIGVQPSGVKLKKGYYYFNGAYAEVEEDGKSPKPIKANKLKGKEVMIFASFLLDTKIYKADETTNAIKKVNNDPRLNMRNVTNVGIVSNMIDSIVYANSNYLKFSQIPEGSKVVIGSNVFEKKSNYLESDVVSSPEVISLSGMKITSGEFPSQFATIAETHIGNIPIINKGFGGVNGQFKDYTKSFRFGIGQTNSSYSNTLKRNDKGSLVVKKGILSDTYSSGDSFTTFCYSFTVSNAMQFRQIGTGNRYYLVPISTDKTDGIISDTSYFMENLDFDSAEDITSGLLATEYRPAENISSLVESLLAAYDVSRIEDFKGLISYLIRVLCTWLIASNTVLMVLRNKTIDDFVYDIKYRNEKRYGSGGGSFSKMQGFKIDIYSILTFGLQNVDSEISLFKGVVVSGTLFVIASFLSIGYFG